MIILGIDPGINNVGYGIVKFNSYSNINYVESGVIKTNANDFLYQRLGIISQNIEKIINHYSPKAIAMEQVFINKNALSSMKLCHARGAILAAISKSGAYFEEISPNTVKKTVTGRGHADKSQVMYMIKQIINNIRAQITEDESDALSIAYTLSISKDLCQQ